MIPLCVSNNHPQHKQRSSRVRPPTQGALRLAVLAGGQGQRELLKHHLNAHHHLWADAICAQTIPQPLVVRQPRPGMLT